jgi:hypothetical protein
MMNKTTFQKKVIVMNKIPSIFLLVVVTGFIIMPVTAADQYLGGSPQLTAYVAGISEFSEGQDVSLPIVIQNSGTNTARFVDKGTVSTDDLPTTAKLVKAGLSSGMAPVTIKTDPQNIGDLVSPSITTVLFRVKITTDATAGEYQLPLTVQYKYLSNSISVQPSSNTVAPVYHDVTTVIPVTIRIKPVVKVDIVNVSSENLITGTEGYIDLTIRNSGPDNGAMASVILLRNGQSPIIPSDSSVFIGNFPQGKTVSCRYKVAVTNDAEHQQTHPVDVKVTYTNAEGKIVDSTIETIGVPVGGKLGFAVTSRATTINQGESKAIEVEYKNTGTITAHKAQARITIVEPFDSTDTMAYLGDVAPGQTVTGIYTISVRNTADPATYQLDTNVRYRDAFDNSIITDTVSVPVDVKPTGQKSSLLPVAGILVVLAIIGIGAYILKRRR